MSACEADSFSSDVCCEYLGLQIFRRHLNLPLCPSQGLAVSNSELVFDNLCLETLIGSLLLSCVGLITAFVNDRD